MPPTFDLAEDNFVRLQGLAIPLIDDLNSVIRRILDQIDTNDPPTEAEARASVTSSKKFDAFTPPDLTHTKLIAATIDSKDIEQRTWRSLRDTAIRALVKVHNGDIAKFGPIILSRFARGNRNGEDGFAYLEDIDLSVQGQDAIGCYKTAFHIALNLGLPIRVQFLWRQKEAAAHPGVTGLLRHP